MIQQALNPIRGRWFITPTARQQWQAVVDDRVLGNEETDREILAWAEDAIPMHKQDHLDGATKYRAKAPLKCVFLVDESERPLPALVGVLRPHAGFRPGSFDPRTRAPHRPGRPRTVTQPGQPASEGRPQIRERVPDDVAKWVRERQRLEPGYLANLVREDMRKMSTNRKHPST